MQELLELGAPALPDGYFYRVKQNFYGILCIEIRKAGRFKSRMIADSYSDPHLNTEGDPKQAILKGIRFALDNWGAKKEIAEMYSALHKWEGDHK
jgi:hypothetical protein